MTKQDASIISQERRLRRHRNIEIIHITFRTVQIIQTSNFPFDENTHICHLKERSLLKNLN